MNNEKKDKIQRQALQAWLDNKKVGTCEIVTGLGKTFIALHALYTMPKNDDIHLFLAETINRKKDLVDNINKYNKIFNRNVLGDYNLKFFCYQTTYKWKDEKFGLVIADEIHDSLTPAYSKFYFNNHYKAIIGLSATINKSTSYELENQSITKGSLINKICPICFNYGLDQGKKDGTVRNLDVYVILHKLESVKKTIEAGNKKNRFLQTELAAYSYWDKQHKQSWYIEDDTKRDLRIRITSTKRSNILYNLNSKVQIVKDLLTHLKSKTIIFGNSIDSLKKVTNNVVSSRNKEEVNNKIINDFENDKITTIGSFKKLKQGANLTGLDNCIIMSYYSTDKDLIQRVGRLRQNGKIGNVFILLTANTQEEVWFNKMFENINDLNLIYCPDLNFCLDKLKKNEKL